MMNAKEILAGFQSLSPQKKLLAAFVAVSVLGGLGLFSFFAARPEFAVLYANLNEEDGSRVIAKLQEMKVPYRVLPGGRGLEVPEEKVNELRLVMAGAGISAGGNVGFELFDKDTWASSRFIEGVNYRRALQGELARTIMSLSEVERARVHLVMPERTPFVATDQARPKASVVLKLRGGRSLDPSRVQGIVALVSGSVEGLAPEQVSVVDTGGRLLSGSTKTEAEMEAVPAHQLEYRRALEGSLEQRVARMLEKVTGPENVIVRVSAELDFRKVEKEEELYDPDSVVVRSEQKRSEKTGSGGAAGVPGVGANLPGASPGASLAGPPSEKKEQVLNYEINRVVKRMVEAPGAIQRLSVAVLLREKGQVQESGLEEIAALVKGAVGFNADRGDLVEVSLMPFDESQTDTDTEPAGGRWRETAERLLPYALKYLGLAVGVLILALMVFRPMIRNMSLDGNRLAKMQQQLTETLQQPSLPAPEVSERDKLVDLVREDPAKAAQIMKMWLREG